MSTSTNVVCSSSSKGTAISMIFFRRRAGGGKLLESRPRSVDGLDLSGTEEVLRLRGRDSERLVGLVV